jgi:hypothetical protein
MSIGYVAACILLRRLCFGTYGNIFLTMLEKRLPPLKVIDGMGMQ